MDGSAPQPIGKKTESFSVNCVYRRCIIMHVCMCLISLCFLLSYQFQVSLITMMSTILKQDNNYITQP